MKQTLFISYAWANSDIADKIEEIFRPTGLKLLRDVRDLQYKSSIKEFMAQVRSADFVLLSISDDFIKSSNCMYEVLELLKDVDFKQKILPVVLDGTKIYKAKEKLEYIEYWTKQHDTLKEALKAVIVTDAVELYTELKHIENIRGSISEFLNYISDTKVPSFSKLLADNFKPIFDHIGVTDRVIIDQIIALGQINDIDERELALDKLDGEYPNNAKICVAKAINAFRVGKIPKSSFWYRKSIELDANFASAYYNLGYNVEVYDADFEEAERLYSKSIELEPTNFRAIVNLGRLFSHELKDPKKGREYYEKALLLRPYDAEAHYNYATLIAETFNDKDVAREHYEVAIAINPNFAAAMYNYSHLLIETYEDKELSKKVLLKAIRLEPTNKSFLNQMAWLEEKIFNNYREAKLYYDRYMNIESITSENHYDYSRFLILFFETSHKQEAINHYELAIKSNPTLRSIPMEKILY